MSPTLPSSPRSARGSTRPSRLLGALRVASATAAAAALSSALFALLPPVGADAAAADPRAAFVPTRAPQQAPQQAPEQALVGTFRLTPGSCAGGRVAGTYLRMILPDGDQSGPFLSNNDSACSDKTYTLLAPGTDGGLVTGGLQPAPSPVFDGAGNAQARRITAPVKFYGTAFGMVTSSPEVQTRSRVPEPTITVSGTRLSGDLRAFSVTWNDQYFQQGSPKPDGSRPGNTTPVSGSYDARTGAFVLTWSSQVEGGPFDKFTGQWHLSGTFVPAAATPSPTTAPEEDEAPAGVGDTTTADPGTPVDDADTGVTGPATPTPGDGADPGLTGAPETAAGDPALPGVSSPGTPTVATAAPVSTDTVIEQGWQLRWWQLLLALVVAVLGFAALAVLNRRIAAAEVAS